MASSNKLQTDIDQLDFQKGDGLLPVIIQDSKTYQVLMLGYMNQRALEKTIDEERVTFYSRSKERLWTKGETSGNYLDLVDLQADCDNDTLLILVEPHGPVCHTGNTSCFYQKAFKSSSVSYAFLDNLQELLKSRKSELPENSYTSTLFREGADKISQKVGEEAIETVIAAKNDNEEDFIYESSDLLFHLMVLLTEKDITLQQLVKELERRHG